MELLRNLLLEKDFSVKTSTLEKIRQQFVDEFAYTFNVPEGMVTPQWIIGQLTKLGQAIPRTLNDEETEKKRFVLQFALSNKLVMMKGSRVVPTGLGGKFKQYLSTVIPDEKKGGHRDEIEKKSLSGVVDNGYKELRYWMNAVRDSEYREWLSQLEPTEREYMKIFAEMDPTDFGYLKGLSDRVERKDAYMQVIDKSNENNPGRVERLADLGFLNAGTFQFNRKFYENFITFLTSLTGARLSAGSRSMKQAATRVSGDAGRDLNTVVLQMHPDSHQKRSASGIRAWAALQTFNEEDFLEYRKAALNGGEASSVYKSVPEGARAYLDFIIRAASSHIHSKSDMIEFIEAAFQRRVDFKGLESRGIKAGVRADTLKSMVNGT